MQLIAANVQFICFPGEKSFESQRSTISQQCYRMKMNPDQVQAFLSIIENLFNNILCHKSILKFNESKQIKCLVAIPCFASKPAISLFNSIMLKKYTIRSAPNSPIVGSNAHSLAWDPVKSMIEKIIVPNEDKRSFTLKIPTVGEWETFKERLPILKKDPEIRSIFQIVSETFSEKGGIDQSIFNKIGTSISNSEELVSYVKKAHLFDEEDRKSWVIGEACFLHLFKQANHFRYTDQSFNNAVEILSTAGRYVANIQGLSSIGLLFHLDALCLRKANRREVTAANYTNIGECLRDLGHNKKALECFQKALGLELSFYGKRSAIARSYTNLAKIQNHLGNYQEGLSWIKKAIGIQKEIFNNVLGLEHPDIARSYHAKGISNRGLNLDQKTSKYLVKAKDLREKIFKTQFPPTLGISYNDLGMHLLEMGEYDEALKNLTKALELQIDIFGETHPHPLTATYYNNIGLCLMELKEYEAAKFFVDKALEIRMQVLGNNHPILASSYILLGKYYQNFNEDEYEITCENSKQKSYEKALDYFNKGLAILKAHNEPHPETATCEINIRITSMLLECYPKAEIKV